MKVEIAIFSLLALAWGSSFFWIKMILRELSPVELVAFRLLIAATTLSVFAFFSKVTWPKGKKLWGHLALMAAMNPLLPFILISWAEVKIDSSLASVLNSTVPLFGIVLAPWMLKDETPRLVTIGGVVMGFAGVLLLLAPKISSGGPMLEIVAVLLAAFFYAFSTIYSRKYLRGISPIAQTASLMILSCTYAWVGLLCFGRPIHIPIQLSTIGSLGILGVLCTAVALSFHYYLLRNWGATRTILVNYLLPIVGFMLGVLVLKEDWSLQSCFGAIAVLSGVILTHLSQQKPLPNLSKL